jgi:hypothetical protein
MKRNETTVTNKTVTKADIARMSDEQIASLLVDAQSVKAEKTLAGVDEHLEAYKKAKDDLVTHLRFIQQVMPGYGTPAGANPVNVLKRVLSSGPKTLVDCTNACERWDCEAVGTEAKVEAVLKAGTTTQPPKKDGGRERKAWCRYDAKTKLWSLVE